MKQIRLTRRRGRWATRWLSPLGLDPDDADALPGNRLFDWTGAAAARPGKARRRPSRPRSGEDTA